MRILALTRYQRLGSSSRVRFCQYFPFLESQGIHIINEPFFDDEYIRSLYAGRRISRHAILKAYVDRIMVLTQKKDIDLIWAEKEFLPWFPFGIEFFFRPHQIPYVVDYDDAVFHRYDAHPNPLVRLLLGQKIDHIMRNASTVIAGNDYIAERAKKSGAQHVEILPSVVDVSQYTVKQPHEDMVFRIGWIGSPVTAKYLDFLHDVLIQLRAEAPLRLILVGAGNISPFPDIPTELVSWNEKLELTLSHMFDVGIMPLIDDLFERGKCGYKLIQYMAGGIPVIASPVGVNQKIVEPGINGYLASTLSEWLTSLRKLRDNLQMRIEMGAAGRQKAERLYDLQVTAPKLLELLQSAPR